MVDGRWSMVDGRWSMVDGRWSMVDGQFPFRVPRETEPGTWGFLSQMNWL